jgi:hypothetical protein
MTQSYSIKEINKARKLTRDQEVISSILEYYKDDIKTGETKRSQLDTVTRYEFSFSGLER